MPGDERRNGRSREAGRSITSQAASISLAVMPFGVAFGLVAVEAGLSILEAVGFSVAVFAGSAQFAAVTVLGQGGSVAAAVTAGLLLNLRILAFGVALAPVLTGRRWWRAAVSQVMVDETAGVAMAQPEPHLARRAYLVTGFGLFATWNVATLLGATVFTEAGSLIEDLGVDATVPAIFLALLWPRLVRPTERIVALGGALLGVGLTPVLPAGLPILAAGTAVLLGRPWRAAPDSAVADRGGDASGGPGAEHR